MQIPITINTNTLKTYKNKNISSTNKLKSWDFNQQIPKTLREYSIASLAENWKSSLFNLYAIEITADRCLFLELLSIDLPLEITVPNIQDDIYWRRCFLEHWPKKPKLFKKQDLYHSDAVRINEKYIRRNVIRVENETKSWKSYFLEMFVSEMLEKTKPEDFKYNEIKKLFDICAPFISVLQLKEMQAMKTSSNRIPLNLILEGFENLQELSLSLKQVHVKQDFSWDILKSHMQDIVLLAKGLEKTNLSILRLINSDVDDDKLIVLLRSLICNKNLTKLDLSQCKISDKGAKAISKFCIFNSVKHLILNNNKIGISGTEALCYALSQKSCKLEEINLKLNPIKNKGYFVLWETLTNSSVNLQKITVSGCHIILENDINMTFEKMLEENTSLMYLDICNNELGEDVGRGILNGLKFNKTLNYLDVRMCGISEKLENEIVQKLRNETKDRIQKMRYPKIVEPQKSLRIDEKLVNEIENIFV